MINQEAQEQLALRKGISSLVIPTCLISTTLGPGGRICLGRRKELGLAEDDFFILQPTRVVPRKGIEQAIKLVSLLKDPRCKLVISHEAGDEGYEYLGMLEQLAKEEEVDMRVVADRSARFGTGTRREESLHSLGPVPARGFRDLPEFVRGFGNASLRPFTFASRF